MVTDESKIYGYELTGGRLNMVIQADNPITATPAIGQPSGGETVDPLIVFPTNDGVVHAYSALRNGTGVWAYPDRVLGRAPALIVENNRVRRLHSMATFTRSICRAGICCGDIRLNLRPSKPRKTATTVPHRPRLLRRGPVRHQPRGQPPRHRCRHRGAHVRTPINLTGTVNSHPAIAGGVVYVGLENPAGIHAFAAGTCGTRRRVLGFLSQLSAVREGLAATPETLYLIEDRLLLAMSLDGQLWLDASAGCTPSPWEGGPFAAADIITTPPVLADGVVYIGSQDGMVHAMDAETGEGLWSFDAESAIRGELVVVPGAVIVTTAGGEVIAIAGH